MCDIILLAALATFGADDIVDEETNFRDGSFSLMPFRAAVVVGDRSMVDDDDPDTAAPDAGRRIIGVLERFIVV